MIGSVEKKPSVRIAGYLEKRGKMRLLVCRWKRWWFVLEGRLLLYYKSQLEYLNLSPCRGSLNMGLAASVRPGKGLELTVITRSQTVTLRAGNRLDHEQWLQSLIDAMALLVLPTRSVQGLSCISATPARITTKI
ncbi:oxysterol-binding protein 2-like [Homalodisca vitripennis]|uniref:oxysterol-binding protein 2-like n=1 Tax=Homalodisca vitripennis TaxID=197043 RepID=UPI001EE9FF50|nr:oxysterol-binding protein 2-like [Homalodisca vitripennis]